MSSVIEDTARLRIPFDGLPCEIKNILKACMRGESGGFNSQCLKINTWRIMRLLMPLELNEDPAEVRGFYLYSRNINFYLAVRINSAGEISHLAITLTKTAANVWDSRYCLQDLENSFRPFVKFLCENYDAKIVS